MQAKMRPLRRSGQRLGWESRGMENATSETVVVATQEAEPVPVQIVAKKGKGQAKKAAKPAAEIKTEKAAKPESEAKPKLKVVKDVQPKQTLSEKIALLE